MSLRPLLLLGSFALTACKDKGGGGSGDDTQGGDGGAGDGGASDFVLPDGFGASLTQQGCDFGVELGANDPDQTLGIKIVAQALMEQACDAENRTVTENRAAASSFRVLHGTSIRDAVCPVTDGSFDAVVMDEFVALRGNIEVSVTADETWCTDPPSATIFGTGTAIFREIVVDRGDGTEVSMGPLTVGPRPLPLPPPTGGGG